MTLTLEDVKNVRFPIAKRQGEGYRATEVDDFVDAVDATFVQMAEENERLKAQLTAIDNDQPAAQAEAVVDPAVAEENARLKAELEGLRAELAKPATGGADADELQRLRVENADLRSQLEGARTEAEQARQKAEQARGELDGVRSELEAARQSAPLGVVEGEGANRVEKVVVTTSAQASPALVRMVQLHTEQAEMLVSEAEAEAQRKVTEAERRAQELTMDAQTRAEKIQSEARVEADQLTSQAKAQADQLTTQAQQNSERVNAEAEARRAELFASLEAERDQLVGKVDQLRAFEGNYRSTLTDHLRGQIERLENATFTPAEAPALLGEQRSASATPRLDALLAEGGR